MNTKISLRRSGLLSLTLVLLLSAAAFAQKQPSAAARLNTLGPENSQLAQRAGTWDVVETVWASPGAAPVSTRAVAERRMIGAFLEETLRPAVGSNAILRIDYLSFHRIEGRWKYVSMDTRAPVGLMTAESFGRGESGRIELTFQPFAIPAALEGAGSGQLLQMRQLIIRQDADHDRKEQYFIPANGSGKPWLGHRYLYVRRP